MSDTARPTNQCAPRSNLARRMAITAILSVIFSLALWLMALNAMTSLLAGASAGVIILAASSTSNVLEAILETIGGFVLGLLAAIGAILGTLFSSLVVASASRRLEERRDAPSGRCVAVLPRCSKQRITAHV